VARNLINITSISKQYGVAPILDSISLGIAESERIGVVGRNGGGKSTLMKVIAGLEPADSGRVTKSSWAKVGYLNQSDSASSTTSVRNLIVGSKKTHEWASDSGLREILSGLFGGYSAEILDRPYSSLSGAKTRVELLVYYRTPRFNFVR